MAPCKVGSVSCLRTVQHMDGRNWGSNNQPTLQLMVNQQGKTKNYPECAVFFRQSKSRTCKDTASVSVAPHKFPCWQSPPEGAGQAQDHRQHKRRQVQIILGTQQRQRGPRIDSCTISWPNKEPWRLSLAFIRELYAWWQCIMRRYVLTHTDHW